MNYNYKFLVFRICHGAIFTEIWRRSILALMPLISYKWSVEKCKSVRTLYSLQYKEPFGDSNYPSYFYFYKLLNYLSAANGSTHCLLTSPSRQGAEVSFAWSILSIACQQRRQRLRLWSIFIQLEARKQFFFINFVLFGIVLADYWLQCRPSGRSGDIRTLNTTKTVHSKCK